MHHGLPTIEELADRFGQTLQKRVKWFRNQRVISEQAARMAVLTQWERRWLRQYEQVKAKQES